MEREVKILVVDDNEQDQKIIGHILERMGLWAISYASTGSEAIQKAITEHHDLMVIDTMLPDLDGFEVLAQIKSRNSKTKTILMTGSIEAVKAFKADKAASLGVDDYIAKTADYSALTESVKKLLGLNKGM
jgi:CheY-like chemotaxis protein